MSKELETVALWRDGGGGPWMGRDRPERPWNWLTGTDASPDDLLSGGSRKVEEPFGKIDPDDVRPTPDLRITGALLSELRRQGPRVFVHRFWFAETSSFRSGLSTGRICAVHLDR